MNFYDYLNSLSVAAQLLVKEHTLNNNNAIVVNFITDKNNPSRMHEEDERYIIDIDNIFLGNQTEETCMHEYLHCVQLSNNYPYLFPIVNNSITNQICRCLNSLILDRDVNNTLRDYGYTTQNEQVFKDIYSHFCYSSISKLSLFNKRLEIDGTIYFATHIVNVYLSYGYNKMYELFKIIKPCYQTVTDVAKDIIKIIELHNEYFLEDYLQIFKDLISMFNLQDVIQIR